MSALARALACPTCAGPIAPGAGRRVIRCPWCGGLHLVETGPLAGRSLARPTIDAAAALAAGAAALGDSALRPGLARGLRHLRPRLFFVPFYELTARRAGRARIDRETIEPAPEAGGSAFDFDASLTVLERSEPRVRRRVADTRIVLSSWSFFWPALELPGWGLGQIEPSRMRSTDGVRLEPFDVVAADRAGTAFDPTVDPETFRAAAMKAAPTRSGEVRVLEERLSVLYYPLWRLVYGPAGRRHAVTIDGLDGRVLRVSGPANQVRALERVALAVAAAGVGGGFLARACLALERGPLADLAPLAWGATPILLLVSVLLARHAARILAGPGDTVLVRRGASLEPQ